MTLFRKQVILGDTQLIRRETHIYKDGEEFNRLSPFWFSAGFEKVKEKKVGSLLVIKFERIINFGGQENE